MRQFFFLSFFLTSILISCSSPQSARIPASESTMMKSCVESLEILHSSKVTQESVEILEEYQRKGFSFDDFLEELFGLNVKQEEFVELLPILHQRILANDPRNGEKLFNQLLKKLYDEAFLEANQLWTGAKLVKVSRGFETSFNGYLIPSTGGSATSFFDLPLLKPYAGGFSLSALSSGKIAIVQDIETLSANIPKLSKLAKDYQAVKLNRTKRAELKQQFEAISDEHIALMKSTQQSAGKLNQLNEATLNYLRKFYKPAENGFGTLVDDSIRASLISTLNDGVGNWVVLEVFFGNGHSSKLFLKLDDPFPPNHNLSRADAAEIVGELFNAGIKNKIAIQGLVDQLKEIAFAQNSI